MEAFAAGGMQLLVATTVIEVGVDVPNASLMVIEHAERFGLAQLHQLRGRIGRGARESVCILLYAAPLSETARARLKVIFESSDGFEIARAGPAAARSRRIPGRAPERRAAAALCRPGQGRAARAQAREAAERCSRTIRRPRAGTSSAGWAPRRLRAGMSPASTSARA